MATAAAGSFKNDDYTYLINCDELIKTCREVLQENEYSSMELQDSIDGRSDSVFASKKRQEPSVASPADSLAEFIAWLSHMEKKLSESCYCHVDVAASSTSASSQTEVPTRKELIAAHKALQSQIQDIGRDLIGKTRCALETTVKNPSILAQLVPEVDEAEQRWHAIWLRSMEYVMILEHSPASSCPRHFTGESSSSPFSAAAAATTANQANQMDDETYVPKNHFNTYFYNHLNAKTSWIGGGEGGIPRNMSTASSYMALISRDLLDEINLRDLAVNMNKDFENEERTTDYSSICGTWPSAARKANRKKNKRIQTYCDKPEGKTKGGIDIIYKDVGYSSDADLSDAVSPNAKGTSETSSSTNSPRRREVRRRRAKKLSAISEKRPWSFHQGDWQDWDYTDCSSSFPVSPPPYTQSASPVSDYSLMSHSPAELLRASSRNSEVVAFKENIETHEEDESDLRKKVPFSDEESPEVVATQTIEVNVEVESCCLHEVDDEAQSQPSSLRGVILSISFLSLLVLCLCGVISYLEPVLEVVYRNPPPI